MKFNFVILRSFGVALVFLLASSVSASGAADRVSGDGGLSGIPAKPTPPDRGPIRPPILPPIRPK